MLDQQVDGCSVPYWTTEQVGQWLTSIQMKDYAAAFVSRNITGTQLLQIDSSQMKVQSNLALHLSRIAKLSTSFGRG